MNQNLISTTRHHVIVLLCLFGSIFLVGTFCQAASYGDVKKEAQETATAIGEYSVEQKD